MFNEGDISMIDEMNKILTNMNGQSTQGERRKKQRERLSNKTNDRGSARDSYQSLSALKSRLSQHANEGKGKQEGARGSNKSGKSQIFKEDISKIDFNPDQE